MKTFKLVSLQLLPDNQDPIELALVDGLIINKENDTNTWLIEGLISYDQFELFEKFASNAGEKIPVGCVITKKDNTPAFFDAELAGVRKMDDVVSLLLHGQIRNRRMEFVEFLLDELVDEGLTGHDLKQRFREGLREKATAYKRS